jgi:hypothetical protein
MTMARPIEDVPLATPEELDRVLPIGPGVVKRGKRGTPPRPQEAQYQPRDQRLPWEVPTPRSLRREAAERQREQERQARRLRRRTLTPQELANVAALSKSQVLGLVDQIRRDDDAGIDCACAVGLRQETQRCAAHARAGFNRWERPWPSC